MENSLPRQGFYQGKSDTTRLSNELIISEDGNKALLSWFRGRWCFRIIENLLVLINHPKNSVKKEALWTLANLCAGRSDVVKILHNSNAYQVFFETFS